MAEKKILDLILVGYVFGIISVVLAFFTPLAGLVFGIVGYVHSRKTKEVLGKKSRILNIVGMILSVIFLALVVVLTAVGVNSLQNFPAI